MRLICLPVTDATSCLLFFLLEEGREDALLLHPGHPAAGAGGEADGLGGGDEAVIAAHAGDAVLAALVHRVGEEHLAGAAGAQAVHREAGAAHHTERRLLLAAWRPLPTNGFAPAVPALPAEDVAVGDILKNFSTW